MKSLLRLILLSFLIFGMCLPLYAADSAKMLRRDLERIFSDRRFADAQWGIEVFSLDRSEILYEKNPRRLCIPASNNKIFTAAAALMQLGPDYCFKTQVLADGPIVDGVLKGSLIIAGFGDPSSSSRIAPKDPFHTFRIWAGKLKQQGIRAIAGDIIGDGASFDETEYGRGWEWDDLAEGFAAPVSALQFNENLIRLEITPNPKAGEFAFIKMTPIADYFAVDNRSITASAGSSARVEIQRSRSGSGIVVHGALPQNSAAVDHSVAVQFPIRYYLSALKQVLSEEGIDISRCAIIERRKARSQSAYPLWIHLSPPLSELMVPLLKMSLNLMAESLARTLGLELRGEGTFSKGKEIVEDSLSRMGINKEQYSYSDGSGLSRLNLASADTFARILEHMYRSPHFAVFYKALPIAGVDGTLANRMKGAKAENNVHAKTGTLANVSALSGYVQTADKEMLAFSIIANNFLAEKDAAEQLQDKALQRLARFSRK
jgi:serine-type D-Ala-D-Ala carboxypeptidase/endopeptidase (penicillin-binding protein 4)